MQKLKRNLPWGERSQQGDERPLTEVFGTERGGEKETAGEEISMEKVTAANVSGEQKKKRF